MSPEAIRSVSAAVQPLVFSTGIAEAPYATVGTAFMILFEKRAFIVTARHNLKPNPQTPICFFPSDLSKKLLPLKDVFLLKDEVQEDFADFALVEIDLALLDSETHQASGIDWSLASGDWLTSKEESRFVVLGYPVAHAFVDYEKEVVSTRQFALSSRYVGPSTSRFLHELEVEDSFELPSFSGLSGAPVFSWTEVHKDQYQIALCGMAVQGTPLSRRIHFVDREVLISAIRSRCRLKE